MTKQNVLKEAELKDGEVNFINLSSYSHKVFYIQVLLTLNHTFIFLLLISTLQINGCNLVKSTDIKLLSFIIQWYE